MHPCRSEWTNGWWKKPKYQQKFPAQQLCDANGNDSGSTQQPVCVQMRIDSDAENIREYLLVYWVNGWDSVMILCVTKWKYRFGVAISYFCDIRSIRECNVYAIKWRWVATSMDLSSLPWRISCEISVARKHKTCKFYEHELCPRD